MSKRYDLITLGCSSIISLLAIIFLSKSNKNEQEASHIRVTMDRLYYILHKNSEDIKTNMRNSEEIIRLINKLQKKKNRRKA